MDYCRFEKSAHKTTGQSIVYRCFICVGRQGLDCLPQVSDGRTGRGERKKDYEQKLKTRTLEKKKSFLLQQGMEIAHFFVETSHQVKMLWP